MAKTKISEYDSTAANNTDVDGVNIAESCPPSGINNAIREVMAHLKDLQSGVSGDTIPVASGGTGSGTASGARTNLGLGSLAVKSTVATADIDADAVTNAKIADDSIDSEHYVDGSIDTAHLADDAVTSAKIGANAVDATALNVSGNGTSGQVLKSDGDGSFSWINNVSGSNSGNGYITFSNGLKVNWGSGNINASSSAVFSFPSAYTSAVYNIQTTATLSGVFNSEPLGIITSTTSNFTVSNSNAFNFGFYWFAIGV